MGGLYEGRARTGMQWRTFRHSNIDEDVKFWNPETEEFCTLFDCMENGNFEEKIITHKIDLEKYGFGGTFCGEEGFLKFIEYKEKFLECSDCDRKHTMKKQRKWNNTQRNKSGFHLLVKAFDVEYLGKKPLEEIYEMIKEMEE